MSPRTLNESVVEEAVMGWLGELGYSSLYGPDIAPEELLAERAGYEEVVLAGRLRDAVDRLNPQIPGEAREEAFRKVTIPDGPSLTANNRAFHRLLTDGVDVEYQDWEGRIVGDKAWLVDFENPGNND